MSRTLYLMMVFDSLFALAFHPEVGDIHCETGDIHRGVGYVSRWQRNHTLSSGTGN
jgi:hypothetical protein